MDKKQLLEEISSLIWDYEGSQSEVVHVLEGFLENLSDEQLEDVKEELSNLE